MRLRAVLFDYGGTLDAPGVPWVERFLEIYTREGLPESEERIRAAFGHATRCAYADEHLRGFSLADTVAFHVDHQLRFLARFDAGLADAVTQRFLHLARADLSNSRDVLRGLQPQFALGVISNFYGNVHLLLAEAGIATMLTAIIDSTRAGVSKPDPAIFRLALDKVGCAADEALYVGDSFEKDILGAHAAGMHTGWLVGAADRSCPNPDIVDLRLRRLADLTELLR